MASDNPRENKADLVGDLEVLAIASLDAILELINRQGSGHLNHTNILAPVELEQNLNKEK